MPDLLASVVVHLTVFVAGLIIALPFLEPPRRR